MPDPYSPDESLSGRFSQDLDKFNGVISTWNKTHASYTPGVFLDVTSRSGPLRTLAELWEATKRRLGALGTVTSNTLVTRLGSISPRAAIVSRDSEIWVAVAFFLTGAAWNGDRVKQEDRARRTLVEETGAQMFPIFSQVPKGQDLKGRPDQCWLRIQ